MITEDYVSFETAKLLEEKGFDESTSVNYFVGDDKPRGCVLGEMIHHKKLSEDTHLIAAPTLGMAMKWLREVHNIDIGITFRYNDDGRIIIYQIFKDGKYKTGCESGARTYEELVDEAIWISAKTLI